MRRRASAPAALYRTTHVARVRSPGCRGAHRRPVLPRLRCRPGTPHGCGFSDPRLPTAQAAGARAVTVATLESPGGRPRPGGSAVPAGDRRGRHRPGGGIRDAGHRDVHRRSCATPPLRRGHAGRVAQSSVDGTGLDLRREDAGGPVLPEPARLAHRGGGLGGAVCGGERGPDAAADHLLVAPGAGGGEPPGQVPAALPAAMDRRAPTSYCTALTMSKMGRYIATTMPPTITPKTTIMTGSMSESRALTAASTSSS